MPQPTPAQAVPQPRRYQTTEVAETGLPRLPAGDPWPVKFLYTHNPKGWVYDDGTGGREPGFWPKLGEIRCKPGANMVPDLPKGVPYTASAMAGAIAIQSGKGSRTFLWGDPTLGPFADYMNVWEVQGGGLYYKPWCCLPMLEGDELSWQRDEDQWWGFLDHLRENVLAPMTEKKYRHLLKHETETYRRLVADKGANAKAEAEAQSARMDRMKAAWDKYQAAVKAANTAATVKTAAGGRARKGGDNS